MTSRDAFSYARTLTEASSPQSQHEGRRGDARIHARHPCCPCLWHTRNHGRRAAFHQACRHVCHRACCASPKASSNPCRAGESVALGKSRLAVRARARLARFRIAWTCTSIARACACIVWTRPRLPRAFLARVRVLVVRAAGVRFAVRTRAHLAWTRARFGRGTRRRNSIDRLRGGGQIVRSVRAHARDVAFLRLVRAQGVRELIRELGHDLKARIAVEDLDGADLGFRNTAGAADERQQPARIGLAIAADIEAEPYHLAVVFAPRPAARGVRARPEPSGRVAERSLRALESITGRAVAELTPRRRTAILGQVFRRRQAVHAACEPGRGRSRPLFARP